MKIETSELQGAALDWATAKAAGMAIEIVGNSFDTSWLHDNVDGSRSRMFGRFRPSTDWSQGGPLIEAHEVCIDPSGSGTWAAKISGADWVESPSPLISACRAIVAAKLGDEVEVPDKLL